MAVVTVFAGAFLLFLVEPMAAKALLPAFGGAASVWTACLLFFQAGLLAGYAWAHVSSRILHAALLGGALAALLGAPPLTGADTAANPSVDILRLLAVSIGIPYVALAATSPLVQRLSASATPYRLYAVSNAAALLALLAYPTIVEPLATLDAQWVGWKLGFFVFSVLCLVMLWNRGRATPDASPEAGAPFDALWVELPAVGTAALMATTNQMCQEIAAIPFLWVLPLALYLLSFVLCFDHPRWYRRRVFSLLAAVGVPASCALFVIGLNVALPIHLLVYSLTLFCCLMLCHGELALRKPPRGSLTRFYLATAAGSVAGGAITAFAAPALFSSYAEFPLSLGAAAALGLLSQVRESGYSKLPPLQRASYIGLLMAAAMSIAVLTALMGRPSLEERRNFYGVLRVSESDGRRTLTHGAITHGTQFVAAGRRRAPTTYYGFTSAAARAFDEHPQSRRGPIRAGFVGLGAGTLARYGRPGDHFRFYEINPDVIALARSHFTFLSDSQAEVTIIEGDARLRLSNEAPRSFHLLLIDAFSSDAIPVHLLTAECADIYRRHMAPGGWLLFHISNHTLDLEPVVRAIAARLNWSARTVLSGEDRNSGTYSTTWMVLDSARPFEDSGRLLPWTDRYASVWSILK